MAELITDGKVQSQQADKSALPVLLAVGLSNVETPNRQGPIGKINSLPLVMSTICDDDDAMSLPSTDGNTFEQEAIGVLTELKESFKAVIASLGVRRPVDLQKLLKLQTTLSWQIFKLANERSVLAAGSAVPSRASLTRFADAAAAKGVPAERVRAVLSAYENFEQLVQQHAGDRTSFNSLVAAATGLTDEWRAADLQHRRNIFRGMSHVLGIQCRTRMSCSVLSKNPTGDDFHVIFVSGYVGLRMLRARESFRVFGFRIMNRPDEDPILPQPLCTGNSLHGYCLDQFCSQPLPRMRMSSGGLQGNNWVEASLVHPDVGNRGVADVMFGGQHQAHDPQAFANAVSCPTEVMLHDLMVAPGIIENIEPTLEVFLGSDNPFDRAPDNTALEGRFDVEFVGKGTAGLDTPDVPRYAEMIRQSAETNALPIDEYDHWRVRLEYPVYQSIVRLWLRPRT